MALMSLSVSLSHCLNSEEVAVRRKSENDVAETEKLSGKMREGREGGNAGSEAEGSLQAPFCLERGKACMYVYVPVAEAMW